MRWLVRWLTNMVIVLLFLAAVIFVFLPAVFASRLAIVYSGSMAPVMPAGAVALMRPVDPAEIKVGDIIAFSPPRKQSGTAVSHRVIEVVNEPVLAFRTKGDANEDPDLDIVPATNVQAQVAFNVPRLGYFLSSIRRYTRGRLGFGLFVAGPTLLLIGSAIRDISLALSPARRRAGVRQKLLARRKRRRHRW